MVKWTQKVRDMRISSNLLIMQILRIVKIFDITTPQDPLVQPHRRLVREGVLHLHHYVRRQRCFSVTSGAAFQLSEKAADKEYVFYLFNDIMVQVGRETWMICVGFL